LNSDRTGWSVNDRRENDGQSNERERENNDAPESLPAYDPDSLITHVDALNTQERYDLLDWIMSGVQSSKRPEKSRTGASLAMSSEGREKRKQGRDPESSRTREGKR